ncbi:MAG: spermidine/putrescine ABC transporter substrate-binding protein [Cryobacterium sp.]
MDGSIESRVGHEVDNWLRWVPRWHPGTHRGRARLCRQCFGSPIIAAAGLATDVPHAVQHALSMRMKLLIDAAVDEYTDRNLPLLSREIHANEARKAATQYRPADGLEPEFKGLDLDPPAAADAPYLFTFGELANAEEPDDLAPQPPPLSLEEKAAIRAELKLADDYATLVGKRICAELAQHRERIHGAVAEFVEPQVKALLADLESALDSPLWPSSG